MISLILSSVLVLAQADTPVGGPISDIIEKRLEERIDKQLKVLEGIEERIEARQSSRLSEIVSSIRELKEDRDGAFAALKEFRNDRENMLGLFRTMADKFSEMSQRWTPLQNLVDRLTALVMRLFWFVCVLGGCILFLGLVGLFLYSRLKGFVSAEIGSLVKKILPIAFFLLPSVAFGQVRCEQMQGAFPIYEQPFHVVVGPRNGGYRVYPSAIKAQPVRIVTYSVVQPVRVVTYAAVKPVATVVRSVATPVVSGCANGQCGPQANLYAPRLLVR